MMTKRTILAIKALTLISFIVGFKIIIHTLATKKGAQNPLVKHLQTIGAENKESIFFIGTSRVQSSINTQLMNDSIHNKTFVNFASPRCVFINNIILANLLLDSKNPKTIYIELSLFDTQLSKTIQEAYTLKQLNDLLQIYDTPQNKLAYYQLKLNIYSSFFTNEFNLKDDISNLLGVKRNEDMGYRVYKSTKYWGKSTILTKDKIARYTTINTPEQRHILVGIQYLLQKAALSNTKIQFILPLTILKEQEKQMIVPIYNTLNDSLKLHYSDSFLQSIYHEKYLYDTNHLNEEGGHLLTNYLIEKLSNEPK